ncbi:TetR family transcriptional regulator [Nonomuraea sp. NPDC047529]|uniref:TetR/AcrR family transcriptional regulator n=1 Tax=Nonomuraea sp. NPDC047529 TaxID=3155623 RepID=UPI0033DDFCE8
METIMPPTKKARADATRNRAAILAAATSLFAREDISTVSVQDIAHAAGVSKAAIFRHFRDRSGLIQEILEPRAAQLRAAVESGPPPLGPGAPPAEALATYVEALLDFVWRNRALIRAFEYLGPDAYYANDASRFWIAELTRRLAATAPDIDAEYLAYAVFTALRADVIDHLLTVPGMTPERIRTGIHTLATDVAGQVRGAPDPAG